MPKVLCWPQPQLAGVHIGRATDEIIFVVAGVVPADSNAQRSLYKSFEG